MFFSYNSIQEINDSSKLVAWNQWGWELEDFLFTHLEWRWPSIELKVFLA